MTLRYVVIVLVEYRWQVSHSMNLAASSPIIQMGERRNAISGEGDGQPTPLLHNATEHSDPP